MSFKRSDGGQQRPTHTLTPTRKHNQGKAALKQHTWAQTLSRRPSTLANGSQRISHLHHCVLIGQRGLPSATDLYRWSLWEDVCRSSRGSLCQFWSPAFALNWTKPPRESRPWPMRSRAGLDRCIHASIDRVSIWPVKWFSRWPFLTLKWPKNDCKYSSDT